MGVVDLHDTVCKWNTLVSSLWFQPKQFPVTKFKFVGVSHAVCESWKSFFRSEQDYSVVYNGIDLNIFSPNNTLPLRSVIKSFDEQTQYFLHVGILNERKNRKGLLHAMRRLGDLFTKDVFLLSVGPYQVCPVEREHTLQLVRELGIENRLVFLEEGASPEELAILYKHAVGLVFPSIAEGFGRPAIECIACGTPCVVANVDGLPEVVGDLGICVDPHNYKEIANGMFRLLTDEAHRSKVKVEGPIWAKRFSNEMMARGYMKIYQSLANF